MVNFVKSLSEIKKQQQKWQGLSLSQKKYLLHVYFERVIEKVKNQFADFDSQYDCRMASLRLRRLLLTAESAEMLFPTGTIGIILDTHSPLFVVVHQLGAALLSGNAVYVYLPEAYSQTKIKILCEVLPELPLIFFYSDSQILEIMLNHPAIHGISCYGGQELASLVVQLCKDQTKKRQISFGFHNAALVLPDADLEQATEVSARAFFVGKGQWPVNISEVFVLESQLKEFVNLFVKKIASLQNQFGEFTQNSTTKRLKMQILAEKGKLALGNNDNEPIVVEDFSHCSPLHQESLEAPILFVQPVKYVHEMIKWITAFEHGGLALIFGSPERIKKIGSQLKVSKIIANAWIENMSSLPLGARNSFIGINDSEAYGKFYSDVTSLDGLEKG